jgi:hypothetical protein
MYAASQQLQKKYFVYVGGGHISSLYVNRAVLKTIVSETDSRSHACPILNAGIQRMVSKDWRVGLSFSYDHFGLKDRSIEYSSLGYMLRCDRIWKETKKSILYSGLSAGIRTLKRFDNEVLKEHHVSPGYHLYLIGADFKIEKFLLDINIGVGTSGVLNYGLKYRFN